MHKVVLDSPELNTFNADVKKLFIKDLVYNKSFVTEEKAPN